MVDYKIILILAICLVLYYVYYEMRKMKNQINTLNEKNIELSNVVKKLYIEKNNNLNLIN